MSGSLRVQLLGGLRVIAGGREIAEPDWRLRKAKSLIKLLALAPGHRLARERVMDLLWPDLDGAAAANNYRYMLHVARRTLDPGDPGRYLRHEGDAIALAGAVTTDVDDLARLASEARASGSAERYEEALALYAGDLLPEDAYEDWAAPKREELRELRWRLLLELARLHEDAGRTAEAITAYERLVTAEPAHEDAHVRLMRLYAQAGDRRRALRQFELMRDALRRDLDAVPDPASVALRDGILAGRIGSANAAPPRHNLPAQLTTFIGRDAILEAVGAALDRTRLVTLTAIGGSGKTRLALAIAERAVGRYPHGVWSVEVAGISRPDVLPEAIAHAMGERLDPSGPPADVLVQRLGDRRLLLLLDGCELLAAEVATLAGEILRVAPGVRILATSRIALRVTGERIVDVPPLALPDPRVSFTVTDVARSEAGRLFADRAGLVRPGFAVGPANAAQVFEICRRLDGLPLAIELAAAQVRALPLAEIAARLGDVASDDPLGPRRRTVPDAIEWSFAKLDEPTRTLYQRLAVFRSAFSFEAAQAVASDDPLGRAGVSGLLGALVDRSLVAADIGVDGAMRYRMLDTVRAHAAAKLAALDDAEAAHARHAAYFLSLAERAAPELTGPRQAEWFGRLEEQNDELRAALQRLIDRRDASRALRMVGALYRFWYVRGHLREGDELAGAALALPGADRPSSERGWALICAQRLAEELGQALDPGQMREAGTRLAEAVAVFRRIGDDRGLAAALRTAGTFAILHRQSERAAEHLAGSLVAAERSGSRHEVAQTVMAQADLARLQEDHERARALYARATDLFRELGERRGIARTAFALGTVSHMADDRPRARQEYEEALDAAVATDERPWAAVVISNLALLDIEDGELVGAARRIVAAMSALAPIGDKAVLTSVEDAACFAGARGQVREACRLLSGARSLLRKMGHPGTGPIRARAVDRWLAPAISAHGAAAVDAWRAEGAGWDLDRMLREADELLKGALIPS